jgi:hypothetical protein
MINYTEKICGHIIDSGIRPMPANPMFFHANGCKVNMAREVPKLVAAVSSRGASAVDSGKWETYVTWATLVAVLEDIQGWLVTLKL